MHQHHQVIRKSNDQNGIKYRNILNEIDNSFSHRANDDDDEDFLNDDPAFDDADQENKENAIELGKTKNFIRQFILFFPPVYDRSGSSL